MNSNLQPRKKKVIRKPSLSILSIFLDGLRYDSLKYMSFLNSFGTKRRVKTLLGYSITCHASMYTGVYPDKHQYWFVWQRTPKTSPFRILRFLPAFLFDVHFGVRYFTSKTIGLFQQNTSYFGVPPIVNLPVKYWPYLDVTEKKYWDEDGYIESYPTIFEILRQNDIPSETVGLHKPKRMENESQLVKEHKFSIKYPWTYLFMADIDHFSHRVGQDSKEGIWHLQNLDTLIERKYNEYKSLYGDFYFVLWSDHGHIEVEEKVDIYPIFQEVGLNLNDYLHVIDANYLRIWCDEQGKRQRLIDFLNGLSYGFVLDKKLQKQYHVEMPDNRYGDIIFYLDRPYVFSRTTWGFSRKINSMHGYLPDYPEKDAVLVSNIPVEAGTIELVDIMPSLIDLLGLKVPEYVDGRSIWRQ